MKHLKRYKLFEKVESQIPDEDFYQIKEILANCFEESPMAFEYEDIRDVDHMRYDKAIERKKDIQIQHGYMFIQICMSYPIPAGKGWIHDKKYKQLEIDMKPFIDKFESFLNDFGYYLRRSPAHPLQSWYYNFEFFVSKIPQNTPGYSHFKHTEFYRQLGESVNEERTRFINTERQKEIIQCYYDSFIELCDLNAFVSVVIGHDMINLKDMDRVKEVVDELGSSYLTSEITFEIRGYVKTHDSDDNYRNSESTLREIYDYISNNLKGDETQFAGISGASIKNTSTHINVEVPGHEKRDMTHPSIVSHSYTGGRMTDYDIDATGKRHHGMNLVKRYQAYKNRNVYQFPKIHADDRIKLISIVHKVTDL